MASPDIDSLIAHARPGDTITLPEGRFFISHPLGLTENNVTIAGQGIGKTIIAANFAGVDQAC